VIFEMNNELELVGTDFGAYHPDWNQILDEYRQRWRDREARRQEKEVKNERNEQREA
jgi:hypothetical protein